MKVLSKVCLVFLGLATIAGSALGQCDTCTPLGTAEAGSIGEDFSMCIGGQEVVTITGNEASFTSVLVLTQDILGTETVILVTEVNENGEYIFEAECILNCGEYKLYGYNYCPSDNTLGISIGDNVETLILACDQSSCCDFSSSITVDIIDDQSPTLPSDITISNQTITCPSDLEEPIEIDWEDNCLCEPTSSVIPSGSINPCENSEVKYVYRAVDACGNVTEIEQVINYIAPTILSNIESSDCDDGNDCTLDFKEGFNCNGQNYFCSECMNENPDLPAPVTMGETDISACVGDPSFDLLASCPTSNSDCDLQWYLVNNDDTKTALPGPPSISTNTAAELEYCVSYEEAGCQSDPLVFSILIIDNPSTEIIANETAPFCVGDIVSLSISGNFDDVLWSNVNDGSVMLDDMDNNDNTYSFGASEGLDGTSIFAIVTIGDCQGIDEFPITINPIPDVSLSVESETPLCNGNEIEIEAEWGPTDNLTVLEWIVEGDTTITNNPTFIFQAVNPGNSNAIISATVVLEDMAMCISNHTIQLSILPSPDSGINNNGDSFCSGEEIILSASACDGCTYRWTWPNGNVTDTQEIITNASQDTDGEFELLVTGTNGCEALFTHNVSVLITENPIVTGETDICPGQETISLTSDQTETIWLNNNGDTIQMGDQVMISEAGIYSAIYEDDNGCIGVSAIEVTANSLPEVTIVGTPNFCPGQNSTDIGVSTEFSSYLWSTGEITQNVSLDSAGVYNVIVANEAGCIGEQSIEILANELPSPTINSNSDFDLCPNQESLELTSDDFSSYLWNDNSTNAKLEVSTMGNYSLVVTDSLGCTGSSAVFVLENDLPEIELSAVNVCQGETATLMGNFTPVGSSVNLSSAQWINAQNEPFSNQLITEILVSDTTDSGTYRLSVIDNKGCTSEKSIDLKIYPTPILEVADIEIELCEEDPIFLEADFISNGCSTNANYTWIFGQASIGNESNYTKEISEIGDGGSYIIEISDNNNCNNQETIDVIVNPKPVVEIQAVENICNKDTVVLEANVSSGSGGFSYYWDDGSELGTNMFEEQVCKTEISTTYINSVEVVDQKGCSDKEVTSINIWELPTANYMLNNFQIGGDVLEVGLNFILENISTAGDNQTLTSCWSFSDEVEIEGIEYDNYSQAGTQDLTASATSADNQNIDISLLIKDENGCSNFTTNSFPVRNEGDCFVDFEERSNVYCANLQELELTFDFEAAEEGADLLRIDYEVVSPASGWVILFDGTQDLNPVLQLTDPSLMDVTNPYSITIRWTFSEENNPECFNITGTGLINIAPLPRVDLNDVYLENEDEVIEDLFSETIILCDTLQHTLIFENLYPENNASIVLRVNSANEEIAINNGVATYIIEEETPGQYDIEIVQVKYDDLDLVNCITTIQNSLSILVEECGAGDVLEGLETGSFSSSGRVCEGQCVDIAVSDYNIEDDAELFFIVSSNATIQGGEYDNITQLISASETEAFFPIDSPMGNPYIFEFCPDLFAFIQVENNYYIYAVVRRNGNTFVKVSETSFPVSIHSTPDIFVELPEGNEYCLGNNNILIIASDQSGNQNNDISETNAMWTFNGLSDELFREYSGDKDLNAFYQLGYLDEEIFSEGQDISLEVSLSNLVDGTANFTCVDDTLISLDIVGQTLPPKDAFIKWWPGNILACSFHPGDSLGNTYRYTWGKNETTLEAATTQWWIQANNLSFNQEDEPIENGEVVNYWVEVWEDGVNEGCPLLLYFNGDGYQPRSETNDTEQRIRVIPNPNDGHMQVLLLEDPVLLEGLEIFNAQGSIINRIDKAELSPSMELEMESPPGVYFLVIRTVSGTNIVESIIIE